ncbi:hypothetical protein EAF04_004420 [Stromatinia cepivora]|nr:hypothetical protein EAF04_004420 [Stromatinia cepivora]
MAMSGANVIVDPDGDLILLLNPTKPDSSKSTSCSSPGTGAIGTVNDDVSDSTDVEMTRSLEYQISEDESTLVYNDRILISSKHMPLASPVFKVMLQGGFRESIELKTTGKLEVPLPDDDPAAMKILINIIHGRMNSVPLKIELECPEAVQPFPSIWKNELSTEWNTSPTNIACWLRIAWHFELDEEFLQATQLIQAECTCSLETTMSTTKSNLPIPKLVADELVSYRIGGIRKASQVLKATITKYQGPGLKYCLSPKLPGGGDYYGNWMLLEYTDVDSYRKDCDSMVLGTLTKSAIANKLYPLPESPYTSWSLQSFIAKAQLLEATALCEKVARQYTPPHRVTEQLRTSARDIRDIVNQL